MTLTLKNISITEATIERLAAVPALRDYLTAIALQGGPVSAPSVDALKRFRNLTSVNISFLQLTAAGREHLKELSKLDQLHLYSAQLTDADLPELRGLKLRLLDMGGNPGITDEGLVHLKEMKQLSSLLLTDTAVTDGGLEHLKDLKQLVRLDLFQTKVTAEGVKKLAAALPGCKIEWDGGVIEPTVAANPERAVAEWVLSKGGTVTITANGIPAAGIANAADLPAEPFTITTVNLSGCQFASHEELACFATLKADNRGQFSVFLNSTNLNDEGLKNVAQCREVTRLYLEKTKLTNEGLGVIQQLPLWTLHLPSQISDAGLKHVANCPTLVILELDGCKITDTGFAELKSLTKLEVVYVRATDVSLAGLAMALKDCKLNTLGVDVDREADLARLSQWPNLYRFESTGSEIGDAGLAHLANQPELQTLSLWDVRATDAGYGPLKLLKKLQTLHLARSSISDGAMSTLGDMPQLRDLVLGSTSLTDAGLTELENLKDLTSLRLVGTKVTEAGVKKLSAALPGCKIEWDGGVIEPTVAPIR